MQRHRKKPEIGRRYFAGTLSEAIMDYHMKPMSVADQNKGCALLNYPTLFGVLHKILVLRSGMVSEVCFPLNLCFCCTTSGSIVVFVFFPGNQVTYGLWAPFRLWSR